jgi:hypothetical protein
MTNTELIRQEIERRIEILTNVYAQQLERNDEEMATYYHGKIVALEELGSFIDSLPKEKHERLPNINCVWYKDGECKKGLPGTKCDVVGCVAYISKAESILIDKRGKRVV